MDKADAAEWLLRRVVKPARASELVGDQLEAHPAAGGLRFWVAIIKLLLSFSWRTVVGVAASSVLGLFLAVAFFVLAHFSPKGTMGLSEMTVFHVRNYLLGISVLLWEATVFSLVRLGWRSTLTGVGVIASLLWSTSLSFFWERTPAIALALLWVGFILLCVSNAKRRRALEILCSAVALAWLVGFAFVPLFSRSQ